MRQAWACALACAVVAAAFYWPTLGYDFVWDDWVPLAMTPRLRDPSQWWDAMLSSPLGERAAFRPVAMMSFMLQLWAGQITPGPFHAVSVALHAANVLLLVLLVWLTLPAQERRAPLAIVCGLVYALHPALAEPVVWISCRYDLLMTFFLLLALIADRALPARSGARAALVAAAFLAATLSKETSVGFLLALPLVHWALDRDLRGSWKVYAALFAASLLYLGLRFAVTGASLGLGAMTRQYDDLPSAAQRVLAIAASLAYYVRDALWPFQGLAPSRSLPLPIDPAAVLPVIGFAVLVLAIVAVMAFVSERGRRLGLLFAAFIAALLPVSNAIPLPGRPEELWAASRYLDFPLVFLCLAVPCAAGMAASWAGPRLTRPQLLNGALAVLWVGMSALSLRSVMPLWANDGVMSLWGIRQGATQAWRYFLLGDYYLRVGAWREAREAFATTVRQRPDRPYHWYNLGLAEAGLGNTQKAMEAFRKALEVDRNVIRARMDIARLDLAAGNTAEAARVLEEGLAHIAQADAPRQEGAARYLLGTVYAAMGRRQEAAGQLQSALALADNAEARAAATEALRKVAP